MKHLIVGPDSMEFGWLVMTWVPYCRYISRFYDKTTVICKKQNIPLYADFADDYIHVNISGNPDRWYASWSPRKKNIIHKYLDDNKIVYKYPNKARCLNREKKEYKIYGSVNNTQTGYILIHARAENKYGQNSRNWPIVKYEKLVKKLRVEKKCEIASIGINAYHIPGTYDARKKDLNQLFDLIRNAALLIGPSSGPMHLGELCKTHRIVWTHNMPLKILDGKNNRYRYEKLWRPFNTPVKVIDKYGWMPPVNVVLKEMKKILCI